VRINPLLNQLYAFLYGVVVSQTFHETCICEEGNYDVVINISQIEIAGTRMAIVSQIVPLEMRVHTFEHEHACFVQSQAHYFESEVHIITPLHDVYPLLHFSDRAHLEKVAHEM
jgi:hypothetical protein